MFHLTLVMCHSALFISLARLLVPDWMLFKLCLRIVEREGMSSLQELQPSRFFLCVSVERNTSVHVCLDPQLYSDYFFSFRILICVVMRGQSGDLPSYIMRHLLYDYLSDLVKPKELLEQ